MCVCVCVRACVRVCVCMCAHTTLLSPGKVNTPVTAAAPPPAVSELSDFSTHELLGRVCRDILEHTQLQTHTLQAQPVGEEVGLYRAWSRCMCAVVYHMCSMLMCSLSVVRDC